MEIKKHILNLNMLKILKEATYDLKTYFGGH